MTSGANSEGGKSAVLTIMYLKFASSQSASCQSDVDWRLYIAFLLNVLLATKAHPLSHIRASVNALCRDGTSYISGDQHTKHLISSARMPS